MIHILVHRQWENDLPLHDDVDGAQSVDIINERITFAYAFEFTCACDLRERFPSAHRDVSPPEELSLNLYRLTDVGGGALCV